VIEQLEALKKALEAGGYNVSPSALNQGSALQMEDLSPVMNVATYEDKHIKLQKLLKVNPAKGTLVQFNRQLDYGVFGGSAVLEGSVGQEQTSSYVRSVVPMAYYAEVRRVTVQSTMIQAFDGVKSEDRAEADSALKIAGDIEFEVFRGKEAFSNAGVFDGNPLAMSTTPGMQGLDPQIRQSDYLSSTQDLMFNEYGSNKSIVFNQNGILSQGIIEDSYAQAAMNHGSPEKLYIDPLTHGAYNKIAFPKERIVLAGSPQQSTGASLKEQAVADSVVSIESSRFLSGKTAVARPRIGAPNSPTIALAQAAGTTSFNANEVYQYFCTAVNEIGESPATAISPITIGASGNSVTATITPASGVFAKHFNMYRSDAGGSSLRWIGRVVNSGGATTAFIDLNNKTPGFVTGFMLDMRGLEIAELSPYKSMQLAMTDLSIPKVSFRFCATVVKLPRFNILIDNLRNS
jgi:hypothetical protein